MNRISATIEDLQQRLLPYSMRRWARPRDSRHMRELHISATAQGAFLFDERNCIFVHIPKTGGVSIATALFGRRFGGHRTLRQFQLLYDRDRIDSMFKFAFVRDPWSRLASAWTFLKAGGRNEYDARWSRRHLSPFDDFESFVHGWVSPANIWTRQHFWPQYWFVQDQPRRIGVDAALNHLNPTRNGPPSATATGIAYTAEMSSIVAEVYRTDIELFSYEAFRPC